MSYLDDARKVLSSRISEIKAFLEREQYVRRFVFKEGEDAQQAFQLYRLLGHNRSHENTLLKDEELIQGRRIMLIGNAGSGKTLVFHYAFLKAAEKFFRDASGPVPFLLDLHGNLGSDNDIARALDHRYEGLFSRVKNEHPVSCLLFFDSLDERLLKESPRFVRDLEFFLLDLGGRLAGCIIACRRAAWSQDWFRDKSIGLATYHVDYLGDEEYSEIIPDGVTRQQFSNSCEDLGVSDLLRNPFDGFYLARKFVSGQALPRSRRECLDQRITDSLGVINQLDALRPPVDRLRFLARQLACVATFAGKDSYTPQEATDYLGQSEILLASVNPSELDVLLHCPLFKRQGEKFAFTHQLYREFLAAEALVDLSLRKQRQLLEAKLSAVSRVCTPYRGVAAFLAELSAVYGHYLLEREPLVLFFAEAPALSPEEDETLVRSVLEQAIAEHRAPWWEIPPRGEEPLGVIAKHRPQNIGKFLQPYLEDQREIARLWATACAEAWGGCSELNPILNRLGHDVSQRSDVRTWAVEAIVKSEDVQAVRGLYDLLDDRDDRVRGYVLRAYRKTDSPGPREYLQKLFGGSRDRSLLCMLEIEVGEFGLSLNANDLRDAFEGVEECFDNLQDLRNVVLRGLFEKAVQVGFDDVPPHLVVKLWSKHDSGAVYYEQPLRKLLKQEATFLRNLWCHCLGLLAGQDYEVRIWEIAELVASCCDDAIFDLVPPSSLGLTGPQQSFIERVLRSYFSQQPTKERLAYFQERAPFFTKSWQLPKRPERQTAKDPLEERKVILDAIKRGGTSAINQAWHLLNAFARIEHGDRARAVTLEDVRRVLGRASIPAKKKVLKAFHNCVLSINYQRERQGPNSFSMTRKEFEIPFWILRAEGKTFEVKKIAEIVACYGFSGSSVEEEEPYKGLLEEIRREDRHLWAQCIIKMIEDRLLRSVNLLFRYLVQIKDPIYVERCSERLSRGLFSRLDFSDLLFYWHAFHPDTYSETLRACYETLRDQLRDRERRKAATGISGAVSAGNGQQTRAGPEDAPDMQDRVLPDLDQFDYWEQFRPLLMLMADDDDWAWQEFGSRLQQGDVPTDVDFADIYPKRLPIHPKRLPVLTDWYAFVRRRQDDYGGPHNTGAVLLETIVSIGGEPAIGELRRLQNQHAFPNAEWLSHAILRIEDQMLGEAKASLGVGALLDFLNKPTFGVISSDRDLFEWVCEAVENLKESLELRAEGVAGFWNRDQPKEEPECQNVLWPLLKQRLASLGICDVEEKFIGPNRCDFWVLLPRKDNTPFQVAVELKVARAGYSTADLVEPIEDQIWEKYMYPQRCRYGMYIALWFKDNKRYHGPAGWQSAQDLARDIEDRSRTVASTQRVSIASYVIDLTTPYRKH